MSKVNRFRDAGMESMIERNRQMHNEVFDCGQRVQAIISTTDCFEVEKVDAVTPDWFAAEKAQATKFMLEFMAERLGSHEEAVSLVSNLKGRVIIDSEVADEIITSK